MRPVNLLPGGARSGRAGAGRGGPLPYVIVGTLVVILIGVIAVTLSGKSVSDKQTQVNDLQAQVDSAQAEASTLDQYVSFQQVHDARVATIDSLAKSRFDWERVMHEVSIVIPDKVWLTNLTGTVSPDVQVDNSAANALRSSITGPALEITGCAQNQRTVARMIAAMHDIDGVTRVLVSDSSKPEQTGATDDTGASTPAGGAGSPVTDCTVRDSYPEFELVAAFDGVAAPADSTATEDGTTATSTDASATTATPATDGSTTPDTSTTSTTTTPAADDGGVGATDQQRTDQQNELKRAQQKADTGADVASGGGN